MDYKIENRRRFKPYHIIWIAIVTISLLVLFIILRSNKRSHTIDKQSIFIEDVKKGAFQEYISVTGIIEPISTIQLTPLESGIITKVWVEEGEYVEKDQTILSLTNNQLHLDILNSEASLAEKENFLRDTRVRMEQERLNILQEIALLKSETKQVKRKMKQYERLNKEQLISQEAFLQAQESYELQQTKYKLIINRQQQDSIYRLQQVSNLENSLANMRHNMDLTNQRLYNLHVKSPITGQLGALDIVLGQRISTGDDIGQVNDLSSYKISSSIDEYYINKVYVGLQGSVKIMETDYNVIVKKVYPEVREGSFKIDLIFKKLRPKDLRIGQSFTFSLSLGESRESLFIPKGGFIHATGGRWIYVLTTDGKRAVKRTITMGKQNTNQYEILEGLKAGEKVIISSYELIDEFDELIFK